MERCLRSSMCPVESRNHPFYGDLVNKIRRVKGENNFLHKCIKRVRRLLHRGYNTQVIKGTLSMVLGPHTVQYRDILDRCILTACDDGTL